MDLSPVSRQTPQQRLYDAFREHVGTFTRMHGTLLVRLDLEVIFPMREACAPLVDVRDLFQLSDAEARAALDWLRKNNTRPSRDSA